MQSTHTLVHSPQTAGREDPLEPLVLGRYRLRERLGAGGFGVVWRAQDELLGREVALKRIPLADGDGERASREALAAARLAHPAIVALYEACAEPDAFYLISELVRGETLAQLIAAQALDDERVLRIGVTLADALAHAHARGVIHRDVKPQNVLVPNDREGGLFAAHGQRAAAKLTDFGGARLAGDDVLTRTGDVLGTLAYMAPEQCDGGEVGEAADLYSLALVLYEALCGTNPVRGPTPAATARRIGRPLPPLERKRGDLTRTLTRALDRALAPSVEDRGTLEQLRGALVEALDDVASAHAEGRETLPRAPAWETLLGARPRRVAPAAFEAPPRAHRPRPQEPEVPPHAPQSRPPAAATRRGRQAVEAPHGQRAAEQADQAARRSERLRALWIGCALAAGIWQAWIGRPGLSLLIVAAIAPLVVLTSARAPARGAFLTGPWLLAGALAPVLGLARLAGTFPAIAGQAPRWRTRVSVGALGYWWLVLSEPLLSQRLWLGAPAGTPSRAAWEASVSSAAAHVVGPMLSLGTLLGAALWGAGALCLPWLVRGRRAALDVVAVTSWSAAIAAAAPLLGSGLSASAAHASPRGAVLGAVSGGLLAVAVRALRGPV